MAKMVNIQTTFICPFEYGPEQRELYGEFIMDEIRKRCSQSISADGSRFPRYSKEYKESEALEIAGKSSTVNLNLTCDMLASMKIVRHSVGKIVVGYDKTDELAGQVEGNQTVIRGNNPNIVNPRPFLGLPDTILKVLIRKVDSSFQRNLDKDIENIVDKLIRG